MKAYKKLFKEYTDEEMEVGYEFESDLGKLIEKIDSFITEYIGDKPITPKNYDAMGIDEIKHMSEIELTKLTNSIWLIIKDNVSLLYPNKSEASKIIKALKDEIK